MKEILLSTAAAIVYATLVICPVLLWGAWRRRSKTKRAFEPPRFRVTLRDWLALACDDG